MTFSPVESENDFEKVFVGTKSYLHNLKACTFVYFSVVKHRVIIILFCCQCPSSAAVSHSYDDFDYDESFNLITMQKLG